MRLAVFTSQFPGRTSSFFLRDMAGLLACGVEIDIFPLYPEDESLWKYVTPFVPPGGLPRERIHFTGAWPRLRRLSPTRLERTAFLRSATAAVGASAGSGPVIAAKTAYAAAKAWNWALEAPAPYDQVLGYWGNYAATAALLFCRLRGSEEPFSLFLHAGTDLYRERPYLQAKLEAARRVLVCSEFNREFLREAYPDLFPDLDSKICVHQHGLDFSKLPYGTAGRRTGVVVGVGSFERAKGFDDLIRACHELRRRGADVRLDLVGDGPERSALERLAATLSFTDHVRFRGFLPFEQAREAIQTAEVLAHPSIGLGDGAPNVIKEAMALGTPVVASAIAGIPALLEQGRSGVLVPPRDSMALADALQSLLEQEPLRRSLSLRARQSAEERFDVWRNGRRLAEELGGGALSALAR